MTRLQIPLPTPKELEVLKVLWEHEPCTVRQLIEVLERRRRRSYDSVVSLLNTMTEKGLVMRKQQGRSFLFKARVGRDKTCGGLLKDLLTRAFDDSAPALIKALLKQKRPTSGELTELRKVIDEHRP